MLQYNRGAARGEALASPAAALNAIMQSYIDPARAQPRRPYHLMAGQELHLNQEQKMRLSRREQEQGEQA